MIPVFLQRLYAIATPGGIEHSYSFLTSSDAFKTRAPG